MRTRRPRKFGANPRPRSNWPRRRKRGSSWKKKRGRKMPYEREWRRWRKPRLSCRLPPLVLKSSLMCKKIQTALLLKPKRWIQALKNRILC
jgi:hypothetical protein